MDGTRIKDMEGKQRITFKHIGFVLACAAVEFCCVGAWFNSAGIFYQHAAGAFNVGLGQVALYISMTYVVTIFALPIGGKLLESRSARAIYVVTNVFMFAAFAINALAQNIYMMYVAGAFAGLMGAFDMYLLPVMIARWFKERTGFVVGLAASLSGAGAALWNVLIQTVIQNAGWRWGYGTLAIIVAVVVVPLVVCFMKSYPEEAGVLPYGEKLDGCAEEIPSLNFLVLKGASFDKVVKSVAFYMMIIMALTAGLAVMASQYLTSYATTIGYSAMVGATMTSASMIGNMTSKLILGAVADKNISLAVIGAVVFPIIGYIGMMTLGSSNAAGVIFMAFLFGFIQPSNTSVLPLVVQKLFGVKDYGRIWSFISPFSALACAIGAAIWGFVFDATGSFYLVFIVGIALLLIRLVAYLIALPIARRIPQTEERREIKNAKTPKASKAS